MALDEDDEDPEWQEGDDDDDEDEEIDMALDTVIEVTRPDGGRSLWNLAVPLPGAPPPHGVGFHPLNFVRNVCREHRPASALAAQPLGDSNTGR